MADDPGEELGQMDSDELLEEVLKLRAERTALNVRIKNLLDQSQAIASSNADHVGWHRDAVAMLKEALVMVEHWAGYAGKYFQEKWDLKGDVEHLKAFIEGKSLSNS